jgi:hypothetical protein
LAWAVDDDRLKRHDLSDGEWARLEPLLPRHPRRTPGCVAVEPPYLTEDGTCLVGISKWESKEAFLASGITLRPPDEIVDGETRPRQRFFLEEAQTSGPEPPATAKQCCRCCRRAGRVDPGGAARSHRARGGR